MSKESPVAKPNSILITTPKSVQESFIKIVGVLGLGFLFFFIGQLVPVILIVILLGISGRDSDQITDLLQDNAAIQVAVTASIALFSSYVVWKFLKWRGHKPKQFLMLNRKPSFGQLGETVLTYGVYFMVLVAASILVGALTSVDIDQTQDLGVAGTSGTGLYATFVMLVVLPPIYEELLFRGFLYRYVSGFGGIWVGYVLTSLLFGAAHLEFGNLNWIAAIDTLIFSAFLIYISQKHQSLYSAMLLHAIKNSLAFYILFIA